MATLDVFSRLDDNLLIEIIIHLSVNYWGALACVSKKFCSVLHDSCYKLKCTQKNPELVSDLLSDGVLASPPGGWPALLKLLFCCPGLVRVGVRADLRPTNVDGDDYYYYRRLLGPHFSWWEAELSPKQGNVFLRDRFSNNCLYLSRWCGCTHIEEKYKYMLFRGIFIDFKNTLVWQTVNDGYRYRVDLNCAFCDSKRTWDLYSSSCLIRVFGIKDDEERFDRGFVCENGHVFGVWRDLRGEPLYRG